MGWSCLPASSIAPTAPRSPLQTVLMLLNCSFRPQRTSSHKSLVGSISFMEEYLSLIPPGLRLELRHTPDMDVPSHAVEQALHQPGTDPSSLHGISTRSQSHTGCPGLPPPNRWEELAGLHTQPRGAHAALSAASVSSISHFFLGPGNSTCFATSANKCTLLLPSARGQSNHSTHS